MRVAQWHAFGAVALICWAQWHASTRLGWGWPLHVVWGGQGSGVALRRLFAPSWWWIGVAAGISVLVPWPPSGCSTGCGTPCSARSSRVPPSPCCGMGELPNRCGSIQLIQPVVGIAGTHRSQRALGVLGAPFCIGPAQLDVLMHLARHSSILCRCKGWSGPWCSWCAPRCVSDVVALRLLRIAAYSGGPRSAWSLSGWRRMLHLVCAAGHGRIELPKSSQGRCWQTVTAAWPQRHGCHGLRGLASDWRKWWSRLRIIEGDGVGLHRTRSRNGSSRA